MHVWMVISRRQLTLSSHPVQSVAKASEEAAWKALEKCKPIYELKWIWRLQCILKQWGNSRIIIITWPHFLRLWVFEDWRQQLLNFWKENFHFYLANTLIGWYFCLPSGVLKLHNTNSFFFLNTKMSSHCFSHLYPPWKGHKWNSFHTIHLVWMICTQKQIKTTRVIPHES